MDPWSVLKFALLFSLCLLVVFVTAVAALFTALDGAGVFDSVNETLGEFTATTGDAAGYQVAFSGARVIGGAAVLGTINAVLLTALATLAAFLYNLCADLVGGIEVTLADSD